MASIGFVTLTITRIPNSANVFINVKYQLAGDAFDVALQTGYRETCQIIGDDTPGDGTDDIIRTLFDNTTFFPDPATSNPVLDRSRDLVVPLGALDEDRGRPFPEADEIRAKVTLRSSAPNFRESNLVRLHPVANPAAQPGDPGPVANPDAQLRTDY